MQRREVHEVGTYARERERESARASYVCIKRQVACDGRAEVRFSRIALTADRRSWNTI